MVKRVSDNLNTNDTLSFSMSKPFTRTKIVGGYNPYKDKNGVTQFGEVLFETENMIVLGGSLFTLEKVFGVRSPLEISTLNNIHNVANSVTTLTGNKDTFVCLFGVGIGGAGDSITDVIDVKYQERDLGPVDGAITMVPFRQTADELTEDEKSKYWFKRTIVIGDADIEKKQYFLKKFESDPEIKILWRDAENEDDGSSVDVEPWNTDRTTPIETFIEMTLKINKNDVREYFADNIETARINSIGLFTGVYDSEIDDYRQVKLFSKLNINNEILNNSKDLTISYRIYAS